MKYRATKWSKGMFYSHRLQIKIKVNPISHGAKCYVLLQYLCGFASGINMAYPVEHIRKLKKQVFWLKQIARKLRELFLYSQFFKCLRIPHIKSTNENSVGET